ncbi:precorrin-3B C(17)-methyltransferase [Methanotorris igneus]|uniref:Precorrin-3B C17-methyltransferase n=1 Tax=Methanotorris igneus (strain DSM 5666 / JCM 11834 / Kol 5) TaxID=880724 RepID=F6BBK1_METIK|nr:precorrin-3B C(17)-methyltransferase [Methanotorris igneus]AEF96010.1 precorrin-3B C17-methyltransferase [Methanotorris igneus Kol 5]
MLYVVGIGPGGEEHLTKKAEEILKNVDLIVCYKGYKKFVERFNKPIYTTGMKKEIERVEYALRESKDKDVALVSSGDATIYGLASLAYELNEKKNYNVEIEVIPGITSASSCSAILGAPLNHDFVVLSLSDLLTPLDIILKRVRCALEGDFVIAIYNPMSKSRKEPFLKTIEIVKRYAEKNNTNYIIGIVKNAGRKNEEYKIITINELINNLEKYMEFIDMNTTLIIGNSNTKIIDGKMVTPRGYLNKYKIE